ncbi:hypothetical protein AYO45_00130 [Gammaproteobacteria bacterium SCGC AG-212-F23]|nr:hypothetical protein AYO45_00130 [Gammaproteobacteria bacterium SCGC AG-212-F23]
MYFKVTKIYPGRNTETPMQDFAKEKDAIAFIQKSLAEDNHFSVTATYKLYEFSDHIRTFSQADLEQKEGSSSSSSGSSSGRPGTSQTFSPTPFNTAPRPTGMPHSWVKDDEDKKK